MYPAAPHALYVTLEEQNETPSSRVTDVSQTRIEIPPDLCCTNEIYKQKSCLRSRI